MRSLEEFLHDATRVQDHRTLLGRYYSEHIAHPDFETLYVRANTKAVVIANITARIPGAGAWTRLLRHYLIPFCKWRKVQLIVESVINDDFARHLRNHGFRETHSGNFIYEM